MFKTYARDARDGFVNATDQTPLFTGVTEDGEFVRSHINDSLPTLGLFVLSIGGGETLLMPQAHTNEYGYNVIGLTHLSPAHMYVRDGKLYTTNGYVLDASGRVYHGSFKSPVLISMLEEAVLSDESRVLLQQSDCAVFTGGTRHTAFRSKHLAKQLLGDTVRFTPGIFVSSSTEGEAIGQFIAVSKQTSEKVVVKPNHGHRGAHVAILDADDTEGIAKQVKEAAELGGGALIETYIEPLLLTDKDGTPLESTIRAASIGSLAVEALPDFMVVRTGPRHEPITADTTEAHARPLSWLLVQAAAQGLQPDSIVEQLLHIAQAVRKTGLVTFGLDGIVDKKGVVWVPEINTGPIGAIDMLAETRATYQEKFDQIREVAKKVRFPQSSEAASTAQGILHLDGNQSQILKSVALRKENAGQELAFIEKLMQDGITVQNAHVAYNALFNLGGVLHNENRGDEATERVTALFELLLRFYPDDEYILGFLAHYTYSFTYPETEALLLGLQEKKPEIGTELLLKHYLFGDQAHTFFNVIKTQRGTTKIRFEYLAQNFVYWHQKSLRGEDRFAQTPKQELERVVASILPVLAGVLGDCTNTIACIKSFETALERHCALQIAWLYHTTAREYPQLLQLMQSYPSLCTTKEFDRWHDFLRNDATIVPSPDRQAYIEFLATHTKGRNSKDMRRALRNLQKKAICTPTGVLA